MKDTYFKWIIFQDTKTRSSTSSCIVFRSRQMCYYAKVNSRTCWSTSKMHFWKYQRQKLIKHLLLGLCFSSRLSFITRSPFFIADVISRVFIYNSFCKKTHTPKSSVFKIYKLRWNLVYASFDLLVILIFILLPKTPENFPVLLNVSWDAWSGIQFISWREVIVVEKMTFINI